MGIPTTLAKLSGAAALTMALVGGGTLAASAAFAAEEPISPADAPGIMERPWPEYPADGDTHTNILVATAYLHNQTDGDGVPYWDEPPTNTYTPRLKEVLEVYQDDHRLGDHGELKEEMWQHFSDIQFDLNTPRAPWGPPSGLNYYGTGHEGPGVEALQTLLIHQGYLDDEDLDGIFGGDTEDAVIRYQTDVVCDEEAISVSAASCVDGLAGEVTFRALVAFQPGEAP